MRIALINGSPKLTDSASSLLLKDVRRFVGEEEFVEFSLPTGTVAEETKEKLGQTDVWVVTCPLYVDGIPGHLLACLMQLEEAAWESREKTVYAIINCGFYEGAQTEAALEILENWCARIGFTWGGGVGVGGGEALAGLPAADSGHGPKAPVDKALQVLAERISLREAGENQYVSVGIPRFLYRAAAQRGWRQMIKANGGKPADLSRRLKLKKQ